MTTLHYERHLRAVLSPERQGVELYPCWFCGKLTALFDADGEGFRVCGPCQKEEKSLTPEAMRAKYPHTGNVARNPEFFANRRP